MVAPSGAFAFGGGCGVKRQQWYQRMSGERVAAIIDRWVDWCAHRAAGDIVGVDVDGVEAEEGDARAWPSEFVGPVRATSPADWLAGLSPGDVRDAAGSLAEQCWGFVVSGAGWARMVSVCASHGVAAPDVDAVGLRPALARVVCRSWWARKIRRSRAVVLADREQRHVTRYCSARARSEYVRAAEESARWAAGVMLERADSGESFSLADLMSKSLANPALRAAELVTRVKGCAEWAESVGWVGLLVTLTAPGRMHPNSGSRWTGEGARAVQLHLSKAWARMRAALWRRVDEGMRPVGVRVCEPHSDGCPHWHMVLFVHPDVVAELGELLRRYFWLDHDPHEPGSEKHRVKIDPVRGGVDGAVGYVLKYVVKHQASAGSSAEVRELVGDVEVPDARTVDTNAVRAWASQSRIRTWQAVGGPSVTIWRMLRRAEGADRPGYVAPDGMGALLACADSGDWCGFMAECAEESGGWKRWVSMRSVMRRVTPKGEFVGPARSRYGDEPKKVAYGVECASGGGSSVIARRFEWRAVARSAVPLGHVSLTVRGERDGIEGVGGVGDFVGFDASDGVADALKKACDVVRGVQ